MPRLAQLLVAVLIVSTLIDEVVVISLVFGVIDTAPVSMSIAGLLFAQLVPAVLLSPLAGYWCDRWGPHRTLALSAPLQCLALIGLSQATTLGQIYAVSAVLSAIFAFSGPAIFSLIPSATRLADMSVSRANALLEIARGLGAIAGPVLGGILVGALPLSQVILASAAWSLMLPALVLFSPIGTELSDPAPEAQSGPGFWAGVGRLWGPAMKQPVVMSVLLTFAAIVFATTFSDVLFVFLVVRDFGQGPFLLGLLTACWAAGLAFGAMWTGARQRDRLDVDLAYLGGIGMGAGLFATGLSALFLPVNAAIGATAVCFLLAGAANGIHNVTVRNAIHQIVPSGGHGRAFGLYVALTRIATLLGFLGGGLMGAEHAAIAYAISGILAICAGTAGLALRGGTDISKLREAGK